MLCHSIHMHTPYLSRMALQTSMELVPIVTHLINIAVQSSTCTPPTWPHMTVLRCEANVDRFRTQKEKLAMEWTSCRKWWELWCMHAYIHCLGHAWWHGFEALVNMIHICMYVVELQMANESENDPDFNVQPLINFYKIYMEWNMQMIISCEYIFLLWKLQRCHSFDDKTLWC